MEYGLVHPRGFGCFIQAEYSQGLLFERLYINDLPLCHLSPLDPTDTSNPRRPAGPAEPARRSLPGHRRMPSRRSSILMPRGTSKKGFLKQREMVWTCPCFDITAVSNGTCSGAIGWLFGCMAIEPAVELLNTCHEAYSILAAEHWMCLLT